MTHANAKHFWDWFQKNNEKLKIIRGQTEKERRYWYRELCAHLKSYCGGNLYPQVVVDEEKSRAGMIITAHGDPKYFSKIEKLVEKAPAIAGWSFVALYPPMDAHVGLAYYFPSVTVQPDEMFFAPVELVLVDGRYNLEVYVAEKEEIDKQLSGAVARVVRNLLGEKLAGLNFRWVAVSYLEAASPTIQQAVVPLTQLPDFIHSDRLSALMVDDKGTVKPRIRR
jgi:hypothetical protein